MAMALELTAVNVICHMDQIESLVDHELLESRVRDFLPSLSPYRDSSMSLCSSLTHSFTAHCVLWRPRLTATCPALARVGTQAGEGSDSGSQFGDVRLSDSLQ